MVRRGRRRRSWTAALCAALLALAAAGEAGAQPVDYATKMTARKLGDEALKLYDKGEYEAALQKFELADQLVPAPTLGIRAARCLVKLGRLVEASERYLEVIKMQLPVTAPIQHKKAQAEALGEREKLMPRIPTLLVTLKGPRGDGVEVSLDDKKLPDALLGQEQPIDPGKHTLEAARKDVTVKRVVDLKESDDAKIELKLPPLPPPPPPPVPPEPPEAKTYRTLGWIGVGAGAGFLLVGAANGVAAIVQQNALVENCPDRRCTPEFHSADSLYDATRVISTVGLIGGLALGGAGVTFLMLVPKRPAPAAAPPADEAMVPRADVFVTWGGAGVRGIF